MSLVQQHYLDIVEALKTIRSKQIVKAKRKNQYTQEFKFGSNINIKHLKNILQVQACIPNNVKSTTVMRFYSDLQLPPIYDQENKLGCLSIDPYSPNYKVVCIDRKKDQFILTLEQNDLSYTEFSGVYKILSTHCPRLSENLLRFQKMLENFEFFNNPHLTEEELKLFEKDKLQSKPYYGIVTRVKNNRRTCLYRIFNDLMLQTMAITKEMFVDYVSTTKNIPFATFYNPNDSQLQQLNKCYEANIDKLQDGIEFEQINYNGQRFTRRLYPHLFIVPNASDDSYLEYYWYLETPQANIISQQQILDNHNEYFNLKSQDSYSVITPIHPSPNGQRCGYKIISENN